MTARTPRIVIADLPSLEHLSPEELELIFGAGLKPRLGIESLETRDMMAASLTATFTNGLLRVEGTPGADVIAVRGSGGAVSVDGIGINVGGTMQSSVTGVQRIEVLGLGGGDQIYVGVAPPAGINVQTTGGRGVNVGGGQLTVTGSTGDDTLQVRRAGPSSSADVVAGLGARGAVLDTVTIPPTVLNRILVSSGTGNDLVRLAEVMPVPLTAIRLDAGAGADTVVAPTGTDVAPDAADVRAANLTQLAAQLGTDVSLQDAGVRQTWTRAGQYVEERWGAAAGSGLTYLKNTWVSEAAWQQNAYAVMYTKQLTDGKWVEEVYAPYAGADRYVMTTWASQGVRNQNGTPLSREVEHPNRSWTREEWGGAFKYRKTFWATDAAHDQNRPANVQTEGHDRSWTLEVWGGAYKYQRNYYTTEARMNQGTPNGRATEWRGGRWVEETWGGNTRYSVTTRVSQGGAIKSQATERYDDSWSETWMGDGQSWTNRWTAGFDLPSADVLARTRQLWAAAAQYATPEEAYQAVARDLWNGGVRDVGVIARAMTAELKVTQLNLADAIYYGIRDGGTPGTAYQKAAAAMGATTRDHGAIARTLQYQFGLNNTLIADAISYGLGDHGTPGTRYQNIARALGGVTNDVQGIARLVYAEMRGLPLNILADAISYGLGDHGTPGARYQHVAKALGTVTSDLPTITRTLRDQCNLNLTQIADAMFYGLGVRTWAIEEFGGAFKYRKTVWTFEAVMSAGQPTSIETEAINRSWVLEEFGGAFKYRRTFWATDAAHTNNQPTTIETEAVNRSWVLEEFGGAFKYRKTFWATDAAHTNNQPTSVQVETHDLKSWTIGDFKRLPDGSSVGLNAAGELCRYAPSGAFACIGVNVREFRVLTDGGVIGLNTERELYRYNGVGESWTLLAGEVGVLIATTDGRTVYALSEIGEVFLVDGDEFRRIGVNTAHLALLPDNTLAGLNTDRELFRYTLGSGWVSLSRDVKAMRIVDGELYKVDTAGGVHRYNPIPGGTGVGTWTQVGVDAGVRRDALIATELAKKADAEARVVAADREAARLAAELDAKLAEKQQLEDAARQQYDADMAAAKKHRDDQVAGIKVPSWLRNATAYISDRLKPIEDWFNARKDEIVRSYHQALDGMDAFLRNPAGTIRERYEYLTATAISARSRAQKEAQRAQDRLEQYRDTVVKSVDQVISDAKTLGGTVSADIKEAGGRLADVSQRVGGDLAAGFKEVGKTIAELARDFYGLYIPDIVEDKLEDFASALPKLLTGPTTALGQFPDALEAASSIDFSKLSAPGFDPMTGNLFGQIPKLSLSNLFSPDMLLNGALNYAGVKVSVQQGDGGWWTVGVTFSEYTVSISWRTNSKWDWTIADWKAEAGYNAGPISVSYSDGKNEPGVIKLGASLPLGDKDKSISVSAAYTLKFHSGTVEALPPENSVSTTLRLKFGEASVSFVTTAEHGKGTFTPRSITLEGTDKLVESAALPKGWGGVVAVTAQYDPAKGNWQRGADAWYVTLRVSGGTDNVKLHVDADTRTGQITGLGVEGTISTTPTPVPVEPTPADTPRESVSDEEIQREQDNGRKLLEFLDWRDSNQNPIYNSIEEEYEAFKQWQASQANTSTESPTSTLDISRIPPQGSANPIIINVSNEFVDQIEAKGSEVSKRASTLDNLLEVSKPLSSRLESHFDAFEKLHEGTSDAKVWKYAKWGASAVGVIVDGVELFTKLEQHEGDEAAQLKVICKIGGGRMIDLTIKGIEFAARKHPVGLLAISTVMFASEFLGDTPGEGWLTTRVKNACDLMVNRFLSEATK